MDNIYVILIAAIMSVLSFWAGARVGFKAGYVIGVQTMAKIAIGAAKTLRDELCVKVATTEAKSELQ